jgi:nucleoside-diphosphate-sugar epimerase
LNGLKNFEVDQFIFSSTMLVYKPTAPGIKINEDSPLDPTWGYPLSKVKTEELIHKERGSMRAVNLRIAGVYDDRCHSIPLSNQLQRVFENQLESHVFAGDISHGAAYVHMDDLIQAIALCVEKRKQLPEELTLNISEDVTFSYDQIQRMMQRQIFGKEWKTWSVPKPIAKIGAWAQEHLPFMKPSFIKPWMIDHSDEHFEMDISKAKKIIGWEPQHRVDKTISLWIEELRRDPIMWYDENKLKKPRCLGKTRNA